MPSAPSAPALPSGLGSSLSKLALTALLASTLLIGTGFGPVARGQAKDDKLSLLLSTNPKATKDEGVELRPNVPQNVYVFVKNDDNKERTVTVEVRGNGNVETMQEVKAAAGKITPVPFLLPMNAPKPAPLVAASGPISFRLVEGKDAISDDVKLPIAAPSKYVQAKATFYPADEKNNTPNRLEVRVNRKANFPFVSPPACRVEIDLSRVEGLQPGVRKKYGNFLPTDAGSTLVLKAENLRFTEGSKGQAGGFVSLSVDGYEGALLFAANFDVTKDSPETLQEQTTAVCRIDCPAVTAPSPKFPVKLEVDANVALIDKLRLDVLASVEKDEKSGKDKETYAEYKSFPGSRQVSFRYSRGGPGGSLTFQPEVGYWNTTVDLSGAPPGRTKLRLVALKADDTPVEVRDGSAPGNPVPSVTREIKVDDTKPDQLEFIHRPNVAYRGRSFVVGVRATDAQSDVTRVRFYLGKTYPDGKLPQEVTPVEAVYAPEEDSWSARISVPSDQKSPLRVNVIAINGVDLSETKFIDLDVDDPPPGEGGIRGKVFEKNAPVENAMVLLVNPRNEIEDRTQSSKTGVYEFQDVPRGKYRLIARRADGKARAERSVAIKDKNPLVDQDLNLEEPTTISGKVIEDGVPVDNLIVSLFTAKNELRGRARSSGGGAFTFENVVSGSYVLKADRPSTRGVGELPVEVKRSMPVKGIEVVLKTPKGTATISGKVVELDNPVDGVTVQLVNSDNEVIDKIRTSNGGVFVFKAVTNGNYRLRAARQSTPSSGEVEVSVRDLAPVKDVELVLKTGRGASGRIEGTVVEGTRLQKGVPVQLLNPANQVVVATTTDDEGRFAFASLPPGSYRVVASKSSNQTRGIKAVELAEGQEVKGLEVPLYRR